MFLLKSEFALNKVRSFFIVLIAVLVFLADSGDTFAKKKKYKSAKKSKSSYEQLVKERKAERIKVLYDYFPIYEKWEEAEIYPYNDFIFLDNYDKTSVFTDFAKRKLLIERVNEWLGVRYRLPGRGRNGVDCSNFVSIIIEETLNIDIPAGASNQSTLFRRIVDIESLQFGDLMFFSGRNKRSKRIGHVGIYIGNGIFAHSSTGKGVIYTHISDGYYMDRYRWGGRIVRSDFASKITNNDE